MATKFVYTDTEVQEVIAKYQAGVPLETLASEYNKSVASVRMKLVKLGVYQKATKTPATKTTNTTVVKKPASTSKSAMLADFKQAHGLVGTALF